MSFYRLFQSLLLSQIDFIIKKDIIIKFEVTIYLIIGIKERIILFTMVIQDLIKRVIRNEEEFSRITNAVHPNSEDITAPCLAIIIKLMHIQGHDFLVKFIMNGDEFLEIMGISENSISENLKENYCIIKTK